MRRSPRAASARHRGSSTRSFWPFWSATISAISSSLNSDSSAILRRTRGTCFPTAALNSEPPSESHHRSLASDARMIKTRPTRPAESTGGPRCVGVGCPHPPRWCMCPIGPCLSSDRRNDRCFDSLYVRSRRTAARTPSPPQRRVARVATVPGRTWMREGARGGRLPGQHGPPRPQAREPCMRMRMGSGLDEAGEVRPRRGRPGEPRPRYPRGVGLARSAWSWPRPLTGSSRAPAATSARA
jgi:hypothetical protein